MREANEALKRALAEQRSTRTWQEAAAQAGLEVWCREGEDEWLYDDPPEELALPRRVEWPEDIKRLALAAYRETFDRFLEPGQYYVLVWPPRGELWDPGSWYFEDPEWCEQHGEDIDDACPACRRLDDDGVRVIESPARWSWEIEVQTWELVEAPVGQLVSEQVDDDPPSDWNLGTTHIDPFDVEYGPHRDSPYRQLLYRAAARR